MNRPAIPLLCCLAGVLLADAAWAFCGFYVAKADAKLFNKASQVVLVRDADRTVITMANDFRGDPTEFALVVPVPTFIERGQIHVGDKALIDHLDAYTAPRLVEYFDADPCQRALWERRRGSRIEEFLIQGAESESVSTYGVTIEASYTVGEYDILILSAEESGGLETWLRENGYRIPEGAAEVLGSYIKQDMRFFVAKVNLAEQAKLGYSYLRPLQVAYESPRFMLPIRLGTVNADGKQELFVYTLTRRGRVETTNYRSVKLPTGTELPGFVKEEFADFYRAMFDTLNTREGGPVVFVEYAWDMNWCDPCAADPLSVEELTELGVFWLARPGREGSRPILPPKGVARDVFVTRLHLRYDAASFPDDLVFQQTTDRTNFQGRYVLRHPWTGDAECEAADRYRAQLPERLEREVQALASLTGWDIEEVRTKAEIPELGAGSGEKKSWWEVLWNRDE